MITRQERHNMSLRGNLLVLLATLLTTPGAHATQCGDLSEPYIERRDTETRCLFTLYAGGGVGSISQLRAIEGTQASTAFVQGYRVTVENCDVVVADPTNMPICRLFSENFPAVQESYIAYYGRPADPGGRDFWAGQLDAMFGSLDAIIEQFGASQEFYDEYGEFTNEELIDIVYDQMFCREPDPEGRAFYLGMLNSGDMTLSTITLDILNGAQNEDAAIIEDKLAVAEYFTEEVIRLKVSYGSDDIGAAHSILYPVCGGPDDYAEGIARADEVLMGMR